MASSTAKAKFAITSLMRTFTDDRFASDVVDMLKDEVVNHLSAGISPVEGGRKFAPYKNPDRYPGNRKAKSPVTLHMTGELYAGLTGSKDGNDIRFGVQGPAAEYAPHLNSGTEHMEARPILPTEEGQQFTQTIQRKLIALYNARLRDTLKRSNEK